MSQSKALAEAKRLQAAVQRHGVKCTIELKIGRPWTGDDWYSEKEVLMNHHTAGPSSGLTPSYKVCRDGRPGVPGPLCNGYGGRDKVFRIVTMGLANHPGAGGPLTVAGVRLPKDSARIASFGIEWEHNGTSPWPADMKEFMGRVGAAVLEWMGRPLAASIEHKTWAPTRKIDRNLFTAATGQALIRQYQGGTVPPIPPPIPDLEDEDMFVTPFGSSLARLVAGNRIYGITRAQMDVLAKAGIEKKTLSNAAVEILQATLIPGDLEVWSYRNPKIPGGDAFSRLVETDARTKVILEAVQDIPGVDGDALAQKVAAEVNKLSAVSVVDELADRLGTE